MILIRFPPITGFYSLNNVIMEYKLLKWCNFCFKIEQKWKKICILEAEKFISIFISLSVKSLPLYLRLTILAKKWAGVIARSIILLKFFLAPWLSLGANSFWRFFHIITLSWIVKLSFCIGSNETLIGLSICNSSSALCFTPRLFTIFVIFLSIIALFSSQIVNRIGQCFK